MQLNLGDELGLTSERDRGSSLWSRHLLSQELVLTVGQWTPNRALWEVTDAQIILILKLIKDL